MSEQRFVVIGSGPAGNTAATIAAVEGVRVTLIESDVVGGAAHLYDCIPSKALVASSMRLANVRASGHLGLADLGDLRVDMDRLAERRESITTRMIAALTGLLESQGVEIVHGRGRLTGPASAAAETADGVLDVQFDAALLAAGSMPRVPNWAEVDGERVLTTRHAYRLSACPEHLVVIGSGASGVELAHIFSSLGCRVTLLVSRQQVLPHHDPEVAAVVEEDFLARGVVLLKGARADAACPEGDGAVVHTEDGRVVRGSHVLLAVGLTPNTADLGLEAAGVTTAGGFVVVDEYQRTSVPAIYAAGDITGQLLLSSVAAAQGRVVGRQVAGLEVEPVDLRRSAQAIFTEPEIACVGLGEADAAAQRRKVRITKVPFVANPRSLIQANPRGFVKLVSDPATNVVLGGTIVGHHASELIGILALAVRGGLRIDVLESTLMVHPSLAESVTEAAG
jgi:pyruvate/2-oxoglutarate dehydrogenase complex dihydrolipoamide dehydrogenase (E3) component